MHKQADFLAHYHARSNVESTFSAVKRRRRWRAGREVPAGRRARTLRARSLDGSGV